MRASKFRAAGLAAPVAERQGAASGILAGDLALNGALRALLTAPAPVATRVRLTEAAFDAVERHLEKINDLQKQQVKPLEGAGQSGMVVRLFPEQSYGFIEIDNSPELYFTRNAVVGGDFGDLKVGMMVHVTRATEEGPMGPQASSVRLLDKSRTPA